MKGTHSQSDTIHMLFVGSVVPDNRKYVNSSFSRAGNLCQSSLISALNKETIHIDKIISVRPVPSYPSTRRLFFLRKTMLMNNCIVLEIMPFLNITPLKQLTLGVVAAIAILKWALSIKNGDWKIIYTFNITVPPGIFILLIKRIIRAKAVGMIYDINVPGQTVPRTLYWKMDFWQHKIILKKYDGLVVINSKIIEDFAPRIPYVQIEGGVNEDDQSGYLKMRRTEKREEEGLKIAVAGSLKEANGIREILSAFALLEGERYRLYIAGRGVLENEVRLAALRDKRIRYLGYLDHKSVLEFYTTANVLINMRLTRRINTKYFFPSKLMEYLASGTAVISTNAANIVEEYGPYVYLLEDETPDGLAEMLKKIDEMPRKELISKGSLAREFILGKKTWNSQAKRIAEFLEIICKGHR